MSRKGEVQQPCRASSSPKGERLRSLASIADTTATISNTMATREFVAAAIAVEMKALYRCLWLMGTSIVGITVALNRLLP